MSRSTTAAAALGAALICLAGAGAARAQSPLDDALQLVNTDPAAALRALEALAAQGDVEAMNGVASLIDDPPEGIPADPERAVRLWKQAAEGGSSAARLNLGSHLLFNDTEADDARAVELLNAVEGEQLLAFAAYPLARAYLFGQGVEVDLERGSRLMMTAVEADPDNMDARFLLGRAYQNGWGIPADPAAAFRHLRPAADAGDARAQWHVGMMLLNGDGTTRDAALARRYVRASAEGEFVDGMISMAVMLALGQGGPVDAPQARQWYRRAAEMGSPHALRGLGGMLLVGEGGAADPVTGAAYLDLAAKAGDELAPRLQQSLSSLIRAQDPAAIEAAKSRWITEFGVPR